MIRKCLLLGMSVAAISPGLRAENRVVTSVVQTDARTGKLVRRVIASSPAKLPVRPEAVTNLIDAIALQNQVEAPLVHSVIATESNYNPLAVSPKGAEGLMQLIPSTAHRFGVADSFDVEQNVTGGVKYLKYLIDLFHGDYERAVAAYNAGEAAVAKYGGVPPYKETRDYVARVARGLESRRKAFVAKADQPLAAQASQPSNAETPNPIIASIGSDGRTVYRTP